MKRNKGLKTIRTLAESTESMRSRVVSGQRAALIEEERRLRQLEQYRSEYQKMSSRPEKNLGIHQLRGRRGFVEKLNEAIDNQRQVVMRAREKLDACTNEWNMARAKALSLQKFADRLATHEDRRIERREQGEQDDIGRRVSGR